MFGKPITLAIAYFTVFSVSFSQFAPVPHEHSHNDLLRFEAFLNISSNKDTTLASRNGQQVAFGTAFGLDPKLSATIVNDNAACVAQLAPVNDSIRAFVARFRARFPRGIVPAGQDISPPAETHALQVQKDAILSSCLTKVTNRFSEANRVAAVHAMLYPGEAE